MAVWLVGPLAVPVQPLLLIASAGLGLWVGKRRGLRAGIDAEPALLRLLLTGVVGARLGFVWQWRETCLHEPLAILDLRDGGWEPAAGIALACLYALVVLRRQRNLRPAVVAGALTLLIPWTAGELLVAISGAPAMEPLPQLSLPSLDHHQVDVTRFAGKPTVLNLWATWCPPCRREMPLLQEAQRSHPELNVVFVNQGEAREDVERFLQDERLTLQNVLLDARRSTGAAFDEQALPTTLYFDAQGRRVSTRVGAVSAASLGERIAALKDSTRSRPGNGAGTK